MEALLLIFGEILFACLAPLFGLIGAFLAGLLELLVAFLSLLFSTFFDGSKRVRKAKTNVQPPASRTPLIPRKALHWTAGLLGGVGIAALAGSILLFQPILSYAMNTAADRAGMTVSFERATGTLITGNVTLTGIRAIRIDPDGLDLDISVDLAQADVDMWSLLSDEPKINLARVDGVTGHVSPPRLEKDGEEDQKPKGERRAFRADLVQASGVDIEIRPKDSDPYTLEIAEAQLAPFRSRSALFDLLFRANMTAEIADQQLIVQTRDITEFGRETLWSFEDVEAEKIKLLVPRAPLTWLNDGTLSVRVEDRWSLSDDWIDMDWMIGFDAVEVVIPDTAGTSEKLLGGTLAKFVNARGGTAELSYSLSLDEHEIKALRSGDLRQFWDVVLSGFLSDIGGRFSFGDDDPEEIRADEAEQGSPEKDAPEGAIDKLKNLFKRDQAE